MKPALFLMTVTGLWAQSESFEKNVRPLFAAKCYACHSGKTKMAGLDLSSSASFREVIGDGARLLDAVSYTGKAKMPPQGKLSGPEIAILKQWVADGAPWPADAPAKAASPRRGKDHWAFQPVKKTAPPAVRDETWVRGAMDRFILAKLEAAGLKPAAPASKETLLRRVTFDLTGLPPAPRDLDDFLKDDSPQAWTKVVERLLESPQYGEKWGRHWLDVARYADSTGMDEDHVYPYGWRYRDYVVRSFNADKPYDQFLKEQLAGDLLPARVPGQVNRDAIVATGFLALGPKPLAQQDRVKMVYDVVDEQIDVMSKAILGLSVACARCHDHKFDPILQRDYYSLAGIFASTKNFRNNGRPGAVSYIHYVPLDPAAFEKYQAYRRNMYLQYMAAEEALAEDLAPVNRRLRDSLAAYLAAAWKVRHQVQTIQQAAEAKALEPARIESLLKLLPETTKPRKHWKAWYDATEATIEAVAADYSAKYQPWAAKWDDRLKGWRKRYLIEVDEDRDLPARPVFDPEDDAIFAELTFKGGPLETQDTPRVAALRAEWKKTEEALPPEPPMASAVSDGQNVDQRIFVRGDHQNPGAPAPKAFPIFLAGEQPPQVKGSGRLELAEWITRPDNPLTARVMVNRIWQGHFGDGIVRTANNWGATGEKPTHPELLDYLATRFVESGWSIKAMHREILGSSAYRMSTHAGAEVRAKDPGNRLWSRFSRRRMTVEEIRDSMLAIDGSLDPMMGGSLIAPVRERRKNADADQIRRRTLYLPVRRGGIPTLLATFDYGDATTSSEGRTRTNVAPQALFMMNSDFVHARADGLAARLSGIVDPAQRVTGAYRIVLSRRPAASEIDLALSYIGEVSRRDNGEEAAWRSWCRVLLSTNEFLYLD